jgi:deoxyadenosine/deoxycytidine kinase
VSPHIGLIDGGLDLDFHCFTRLFHYRNLLTDAELDLCRRVYRLIRERLPQPEFLIRLCAKERTLASRLSTRDRINIARAEDTNLFNTFLDEWLTSIRPAQVLAIDVSKETLDYERSVKIILKSARNTLGIQ